MLNVSGLMLHKRGTTITRRSAQIIQRVGIQKEINILNINSNVPQILNYDRNIAG